MNSWLAPSANGDEPSILSSSEDLYSMLNCFGAQLCITPDFAEWIGTWNYGFHKNLLSLSFITMSTHNVLLLGFQK